MTRRKFLIQGAVLTAVSLLLRVTNMGYRSFLSQEMGAAGMGLYQLIFSIFMLTVTLSTSGISLAVTRMVTHQPGDCPGAVLPGQARRPPVFRGHCRRALPADFRGGAALYVPVHLHEGVLPGGG